MKRAITLFLASHVPALGAVKRWLVAWWDAVRPVRSTYSQHGEDVWFLAELRGGPPERRTYVDVGANHPTSLSNTYLLYRSGMRGVVVEPNQELLALHRRTRPLDRAVGVGCAAEARLGTFQVASTPVLSTFSTGGVQDVGYVPSIVRTEYVPLLPLDLVVEALELGQVGLLSIDTEGLDHEVLLGAARLLERTALVCVEANDEEARARVHALLGERFEPVRQFGCNHVFRNRRLAGTPASGAAGT